MKRILGISSIRADYDLMHGVYAALHAHDDVEFQLLVGGAHLSRSFGHTVDLIRADGLPILAEIECLLDGDSLGARVKSAAIFLQGACDVVARWAPDLVLVTGDREDALMGATLANYLNIPCVHFFGGDHEQDGHADTAARHAISKLATAHVVAAPDHRRRLLAMGEPDWRICVAGSVALDRFVAHVPISGEALRQLFPPGKRLDGYALLIFHPVDSEREQSGEQFEMILAALREKGIPVCASYPNSDPGNAAIRSAMARHEGAPDCWFFRNLEREAFLSVYKHARFLIGNSSSGILEAASVPLPAINVGLRQKGRAAGDNVIFCAAEAQAVGRAIAEADSPALRQRIQGMVNPYGRGHSVQAAVQFLLTTDFHQRRAKTEDPLDAAAGARAD